MNVLVTGGAGFIGRWVVKRLLELGYRVTALDDGSSGSEFNVRDFMNNKSFQMIWGSILDRDLLSSIFEKEKFSICYHLGASINVQDSIDRPELTFRNDTIGTFFVLEACKDFHVKMVFMSTCMVYAPCTDASGISESHQTRPASPYAGSKIAAENMVLSYYYTYRLPTVVIRPFNTYGPYQKTGGEGGVVAIFIKNTLAGKVLNIYGDGTQTRDLLYVEDCARFVVEAGFSEKVNGEVVNAGLGSDVTINQLAELIAGYKTMIRHVEHIHPQSEIQKLLCDYSKAKALLGWVPTVSLEEGIGLTKEWILETNPNLVPYAKGSKHES